MKRTYCLRCERGEAHEFNHGTGGYVYHRCRCDICCAVIRRKSSERYARNSEAILVAQRGKPKRDNPLYYTRNRDRRNEYGRQRRRKVLAATPANRSGTWTPAEDAVLDRDMTRLEMALALGRTIDSVSARINFRRKLATDGVVRDEIVVRSLAGETAEGIKDSMGISLLTVRAVRKAAGVNGKRYHSEKQHAASRRAMTLRREKGLSIRRSRTKDRLRDWDESAGDHAALKGMAQQWGVDEKNARAFLRRHHRPLPNNQGKGKRCDSGCACGRHSTTKGETS